ncbi:MAG: TlyA family RNA methyltransferase [Ahrensia sp.]|nr:TlyA family RNA methyltransferase [Ahrensia sp.]
MAYKETSHYVRLDHLLVELGHFPSRSRARDAIERGTISIDGKVIFKAALSVAPDTVIKIDDPAQTYVSRAALKLVAALDAFKADVTGKTCLDIGASTGGFTQVLLERGAAHVIALDVGHDQLAEILRQDPRVTVLEGVNARDLEAEQLLGHSPEFIVSDVSFISLKLALLPALEMAEHSTQCILLVKPQFEVGRDKVGRGGIVKPEDGAAVAQELKQWLAELDGWCVEGLIPSPIAGGDGNLEYLLVGRKSVAENDA